VGPKAKLNIRGLFLLEYEAFLLRKSNEKYFFVEGLKRGFWWPYPRASPGR